MFTLRTIAKITSHFGIPSLGYLRQPLNREILNVAKATPAVSLNPVSRIYPKSKRQFCEVILAKPLRTLIIPIVSILAGCAAYEPPALTAEHPAHPEAMVVRDAPRSMTLAYRPSGKDSPRPVQMAQGMQHGHEGMKQNMGDMHGSAPAKPHGHGELFKGEGKVVAVVPGSQVVLDHKPIKGFMEEAMTMGYKVDPPSILEGLKAGDVVHFTIDAGKKAIVEIEKMK